MSDAGICLAESKHLRAYYRFGRVGGWGCRVRLGGREAFESKPGDTVYTSRCKRKKTEKIVIL